MVIGSQWETYVHTTPPNLYLYLYHRTSSDTPLIDIISNWPHTHHRNNQNRRILCSQAEMERHGGFRRWYIAYSDAMGFHRLHN